MPTGSIGRRVQLVGALAAIGLLAGACGGSSAPPNAAAPSATASAAPTLAVVPTTPPAAPTAAPTAAAPTAAAASVAPTTTAAAPTASAVATTPAIPSFAIPSFSSDKDLEAALPDVYKGVTLQKASVSGAQIVNPASPYGVLLGAVLQSLGRTAADVSLAFASDPADGIGVSFAAYRIKGVDAAVWAPKLYESALAEDPGTTAVDVTLGGRTVKRVEIPDEEAHSYAWPRGDIVFIVTAAADDVAGEAIAAIR